MHKKQKKSSRRYYENNKNRKSLFATNEYRDRNPDFFINKHYTPGRKFAKVARFIAYKEANNW